ncbi:MAG TPA: hypothetical protein VJT67_16890, partial [Longimicrobiaceae bacterium]|nr:hypothetical protein [Longimicrobiaceae bacterium]
AAYVRAAGLDEANRNNRGEMERLPQDYADMLEWEDQVAAIARVYHSLPPEKRAKAVIWGNNYGEAGAIDFYGPRYGLPPAVSDAGTYWFFGPGRRAGEVLIAIGESPDDLRKVFRTVRRAAWIDNPWWVGEERRTEIFVAEGPRTTLQALWPQLAGNN